MLLLKDLIEVGIIDLLLVADVLMKWGVSWDICHVELPRNHCHPVSSRAKKKLSSGKIKIYILLLEVHFS